MKKTVSFEENAYVAPQLSFLSLSIEYPVICSSGEEIGEDEPLN